MVDPSDKGSESESTMSSNKSPDRVSSDGGSSGGGGGGQVKTCTDCGTSKTPLWRGGPAGPKSLCNACGIRSRKKRRALLGLNKEDKKSKKTAAAATAKTASGGNKLGDSVKRKLWALGREVVLQRPRSTSTAVARQRRKLGEEEQAAILLMALSCGSVYA
ncbi:hypothetical protein RJ640_014738 [Escallonia rubra]|uniref:GATA-type domain-containing protein n=1 Tax=Escallonia rubra TaxID=112253 RepID=A0AA88UQ61_9ASTE|nr:hypothetical protein RJ640_014738 [Escallonia rubra]